MNTHLANLKSRGYWEVLIRPTEFKENRIPEIAMCKQYVNSLSVRFRGWDYPYYSQNQPLTNGADYVQQMMDFQDRIEFWRYYQSGQFVHYFAMWEDWQDKRTLITPTHIFGAGKILDIDSALYHFTEIFEFASRLATKDLLGQQCKISITLHGLENRGLIQVQNPFAFILQKERPASNVDFLQKSIELSASGLIANCREHAVDTAMWFFQRLNWEGSKQFLTSEQSKLA